MHAVLLSLVFMYAYTGAKLFQSIEEKNEELAKGSLIESKHHFLDLVKTGYVPNWLTNQDCMDCIIS